MKSITKIFVLAGMVAFSMSANAQKIKTVEGDPSVLKNESNINIEFTYDNISVGKFDNEKDYIKKKTDEYNAKDPGRGDIWAKNWINDRQARYEPKFTDLYIITSHKTLSKDAKYTMIFKTLSIEPGYNVAGGMVAFGGRKNAEIDAEVWIVETANRSNKVAVLSVTNAPGGTWGGYDYDTGTRIAESYAISGKKLAKYIY
ncbi:MAG: hypothetical protein IPI66_02870 [Chitinophagaceae bacterium]|nr:hypothetical protein [Chitinophagaceae bacterium]MBL0055125.1 hypothetical protein [Chitinophagaceae bacterium]